jgi:hypothetical protein
MIGSAATILISRPPLAAPARTASLVALICGGASLASAMISLARMSKLSKDDIYPGYPPSPEFFIPGHRKDAESLMIVNVRATFPQTSHSLSSLPAVPSLWVSLSYVQPS